MMHARVACLLLLSFVHTIYCRQRFLEKSVDQYPAQLEHGLRNSSSLAVGNDTLGAKSACSFSGPSWDPLLNFNCLSPQAQAIIKYHRRCKLKEWFFQKTEAAWSRGAFLQGSHPRTLNQSFLEVDAKDQKVREHVGHLEKGKKPKCAVVSNSGVLRQYRYEDAIDSADLVLRFNDAPLKSWKKFVGTKESIRLVNGQFPKFVKENRVATHSVQKDALYGIVAQGEVPYLGALRERYPTTDIRVVDESLLKDFEQFLWSTYDGNWFHNSGFSMRPTTGAIGMLLAFSLCDEVLAYGMAASPKAAWSKYHYYAEDEKWSGQKANENNWHQTFAAEKDLWKKLASLSSDTAKTDIAIFPGFSQMKCD
jgi:hypothetical protein